MAPVDSKLITVVKRCKWACEQCVFPLFLVLQHCSDFHCPCFALGDYSGIHKSSAICGQFCSAQWSFKCLTVFSCHTAQLYIKLQRDTTAHRQTNRPTYTQRQVVFLLMSFLVKTSPARSQSGYNDIWGPGGCSDSVALKYSNSSTADLREIHKRNRGITSHSLIISHCPLFSFSRTPSLRLSHSISSLMMLWPL